MINLIKIGTNSRTPIVERKKIGITAENDIEKLQFILDKELITENTIPQLEVEFPDLEKKIIRLNRVSDTTAEIKVKNSLLKQEGNLKMQFVLNAEDKVVFKSDVFTMYVKEAINAEKTIEEEYPTIMQEVQEIKKGLNSKVDKNTFDTYKTENDKKVGDLEAKVDNLHNYDDTAIKKDIENIQKEQETQNNNISNINSSISKISNEQKTQDNAILNNTDKITLLENKSGSKLNLTLNTENYVMTLELLNAKDEIISTQSIDFPLEQVIINGRYENGSLILTLQNGTEITIPISSLINGLVNEETFNSFVEELETELETINSKLENVDTEMEELKTENKELANNMLWNTTDIQESIEVSDCAKYSKNKLKVFGNLKQETRKGYNLIDTSQLPAKEQSGINITVNNGYPVVNGAATASFAYYNNIEEFVLEPGDYTLVLPTYNSVGTSTDIGVTVSLGYNNAVVTGFSLNNKTGFKNVTITEETHVNQLRMWFENNAAFTNYELKLMLLKGTYTEETMPEFEIYGVMPSINYKSNPVVTTGIQKINIERNMLPLNPDDWENGTIDGTSGNLQDNPTRIRMKNYREIKGNTEYFFDQIDNTNVVAIRFYDSNYNYLTGYNNTFISSIVTPNTAKFFKCVIKNPSSTTIDNTYIAEQKIKMYEKNKIELDLGTTELCKITDEDGNVVAQDKIIYRKVNENWKWQFGKKIRKVIINSDSTLIYNGLKDNNTLANFLTEVLPNLPLDIYSPEIEKITKYNYLKPNSTSLAGRFRIDVELEKLGLEEVTSSAVAEQALKNLIQEKGDAIIYYVATETTYIDCTAEQSAVLDKLYKLKLEKGINNIFAESEGEIAVELQLEYMQDLQSKLNNLNSLEERISNLEESILNL